MKTLLNTLSILEPDVKLYYENHNVVVKREDEVLGKYPLKNLSIINCYNYSGISSKLSEKCIEENVQVNFLSTDGCHFRGRLIGEINGNVKLRKLQYRLSDDTDFCNQISKNFIKAKIMNSLISIKAFAKNNKNLVKTEDIDLLLNNLSFIDSNTMNPFLLRGVEGNSAKVYFSILRKMILRQKEDFSFQTRSKNPPEDKFNSLLSYGYMILKNEVASALESVGLDSYVGFYHTDISGRQSLAFDMMEEFRHILVDRFVIKLINLKQITKDDFEENSLYLNKEGKKKFIKLWYERNKKEVYHSQFKEKIAIGMLPYCQALLLARYIRGDSQNYIPFTCN